VCVQINHRFIRLNRCLHLSPSAFVSLDKKKSFWHAPTITQRQPRYQPLQLKVNFGANLWRKKFQ